MRLDKKLVSEVNFYKENGYVVIESELSDKLKQFKSDWIKVFDLVSTINDGPKIICDSDVISLYSTHKDLWVAGYDQARQLTKLYSLVDDKSMSQICAVAGIKFPAYTCPIGTRMDHPHGEGSTPAQAHQDYPTHQGSSNSISVWIPLHDVNATNGTIELVPGSHLGGYIPEDPSSGINEFVKPGCLKKLDSYDLSKVSGFIPMNMKLGQILVFSQFTLHQSGLNSTKDMIRFSIQFRLNDLANKKYGKRKYYLNSQQSYKRTSPDFPIKFE